MRKCGLALIAVIALWCSAAGSEAIKPPGGAFTLRDSAGRAVTDRDFRGNYMLVFFGFTHCPELCPAALLTISQALKQLGPDSARIRALYVTLDPERDGPAEMRAYMKHFDSAIIGLTGTTDEVAAAAKSYKVFSKKAADQTVPGGYGINHSGYIYLMDPEGEFLTVFDAGVTPETLSAGIKKYVRK